eukprot:CAMPEP_0172796174 /NCGR_PEP_ID=MMETSP1074-20121228/210854_1 /TAXON_ID=2916 /ORGANISM="Ceratium fusus, Strain PA161109" /LENGTH=66 /DNA_ID=CAMNT_0013633265 /DNA_START=607 /DNA_END=807 /DNA_ORIENTATION=+
MGGPPLELAVRPTSNDAARCGLVLATSALEGLGTAQAASMEAARQREDLASFRTGRDAGSFAGIAI